jgi:hypothetical protein
MLTDLFGRFGAGLTAGIAAFRRAMLHGSLDGSSDFGHGANSFESFCRWENRVARWRLLWAFYDNSALWEEVHPSSNQLKTEFGLYDYTRMNFSPINRLVGFHQSHIYGGILDKEAGDGQQVKSAIPIETKGKGAPIRRGLSQLWKDSRWAVAKDVWSLQGAAIGDIALKACDDPERGRVTMKVFHPAPIKWVDRDPDTGRTLGYLLEEKRYRPGKGQLRNGTIALLGRAPLGDTCTYHEECWIDGGKTYYRTYLNGALFDWRKREDGSYYGTDGDGQPEWEVPYPFIPLVLTQHVNVGLAWGLAEGSAVVAKVLELADVGSNEGDYVRRILNDVAFITGTQPGEIAVTAPKGTATAGNPMPGRTRRSLFGVTNENAGILFTTQGLDLAAVNEHVKALKDDINEDFPELDVDLWKTSDPSGRAMRLARQRAESKVQMRRTNYDEALEAMQRMCLAIGGLRGYEGYEGLGTEEPWDDKVVAHSIAHRPVFAPDPIDDITEGDAFWTMVGKATATGVPLEVVLRREGWSEEDIQEIVDAKDMNDQKQLDQQAQRMQAAGADVSGASGDGALDGSDGLGAPDAMFQLNGAA